MSDEPALRRESIVLPCHCKTADCRPHTHGEFGCTAIPVVATRWISDWELAESYLT